MQLQRETFMQEDKSLTFLDLIAQRIQTGELRERVASFGSESHKAHEEHELNFFVLLQTLRKTENGEEKDRRDSPRFLERVLFG